MVNKNEKSDDIEIEITKENNEIEDIELEEVEEKGADKFKKLRDKLHACESEKMKVLEDLQRAKAEFLNAKRRLEEEKLRDRERAMLRHAEDLLPLCDSFAMAMNDKDTWEKADKAWRTGIEGIHMQLIKLLQSYGVSKIDAVGEVFDPHRFEAIDTEVVTNEEQVDVVQKVVQEGYEMKIGDRTEIVRPARVITGVLKV
jgi:molecular chaperone GrpE